MSLAVSTDQGRRWQRRDLGSVPAAAPGPPGRMSLTVTGPAEVLSVEDRSTGLVWLSSDGGQRFRSVTPGAGAPLARVPPQLVSQVRSCRTRCGAVAVEVLDLEAGSVRPLRRQPGLTAATATGTEHALWAAGIAPAGKRPVVAASFDGGATWTQRPLPDTTAAAGLITRLLPIPGTTSGYLLRTQPDRPDSPYEPLRDVWWLDRAPDGALTVEPVQVDPGPLQVSSAIALADGRLLISNRSAPVAISRTGRLSLQALGPDDAVKVGNLTRGIGSETWATTETGAGPAVARSATGDPDDWSVRQIRL